MGKQSELSPHVPSTKCCTAHALCQFQYDEDISAADIPDRTRPRSADTALGESGNETDEAVRSLATASVIKHSMLALPHDSRCLHPYVCSSLHSAMMF
jgi:hypothetical protein